VGRHVRGDTRVARPARSGHGPVAGVGVCCWPRLPGCGSRTPMSSRRARCDGPRPCGGTCGLFQATGTTSAVLSGRLRRPGSGVSSRTSLQGGGFASRRASFLLVSARSSFRGSLDRAKTQLGGRAGGPSQGRGVGGRGGGSSPSFALDQSQLELGPPRLRPPSKLDRPRCRQPARDVPGRSNSPEDCASSRSDSLTRAPP